MNLDDNSVEEYKCSIETKPEAQRVCYSAPCGSDWVVGEWDEVGLIFVFINKHS